MKWVWSLVWSSCFNRFVSFRVFGGKGMTG